MSTPDYPFDNLENPVEEIDASHPPVEEPAPPVKKPLSRRKKRRIRNKVLPFFTALALLSAMAWCIPLRPRFSELEKRSLAFFPAFSVNALLSGDWFDGISLWFSDTFPFREGWVKAQSKVENLYGDRRITYSGSLVPLSAPPAPTEEPVVERAEEPLEDEPLVSPLPEEPAPTPSPDPEDGVNFDAEQARTIGASLYFGDSAYELYGNSELAAQTYCKTLSQAADKYAGEHRFFSIICPNSGGIVLSYDLYDQLYSIRQGDAIEFFYKDRSENLIPVPIYDALRTHNTEYLYYRTDHHWTALGAYYAYVEFCKAAGFEPVPLSAYTEETMDPFLGSFYQHNPNKDMEQNPDTVIAYVPPGNIRCNTYTVNGIAKEASVIMDQRGQPSDRQYLAFLGGDHYMTEIINDDIQDDSAVIIVKDSYGNPFSVYLSQHYHTVLALDWHYTLRIGELRAKYNVKDILVLTELVQAQGNKLLSNLYGDFLRYG